MHETTIHLGMERLPSHIAGQLAAVGYVLFGEGGSIAVTDHDINGNKFLTVYHANFTGKEVNEQGNDQGGRKRHRKRKKSGDLGVDLATQRAALNNEGKSIGQEHAAIEREKKEISQLAAVNPQDPNITVRNALIKQRLVEVQRRGKALGQQRAALKDRSATNTQVQGSETRQSGSQKQVKKENQPIPGLIGGPQQSGANTLPLGQKPRLLLPPAQSYTFGATHINSQDQTNGLQPKTATTESNPPNTFQSDLQIPTLAKLHHLGHKFTDFDSQLHNTSYLVENSAGDVHRGVLFLNRSLESVGKSVPTSLFGSKNPRRNITEQHGSDIEYNAEMHQQERQGKIHFQRPVVYEPVLMPPIPAWAPTLESRNILQPNPPQLKVEGASQKGEKRARHEDGQEEPAAKKIHHQPLSQQQDTVSSQRLQFKPCAHLSFDGLPSPPKGEVSYREIEKVVYYMPIKEGPEDASVFIKTEIPSDSELFVKMEARIEVK